jgi:signal transduction histidine kinase
VPLWVGEARRGVIWVGAARPGAFGPDDQTFLALVSARVGLQLGNAELARRRAEVARAEVEQQAKQDFLSVVSHELKTPVAVIKAYTEVLESRAAREGASAADKDLLARIDEQADRMLGLVEQFLDLQRIEAGLMPLEASRFDLVHLARRLVEATQVTTEAHALGVEADGPVYVRADRRRIEQVLQNLLDNAIKYSPGGGAIVVSVAEDGQGPDGAPRAVARVRDEGIGLAPEAAARAFERFYQAGNVPVRGHVGLGLGLYISREIVTRHGGEMGVESQPGQGATFWFTLPLAPPPQGD